MSLRDTDTNELNSALERVDKLYDELITMMNDAKLKAGTDAVVAATKNKIEFDLRVNEGRIKGISNLAHLPSQFLPQQKC